MASEPFPDMSHSSTNHGVQRVEDLATQPWKNGRGVTRTLASAKTQAGGQTPAWAISVAEVVCDGAFSSFPDQTRWSMVLSGEGVDIGHQATTLTLRRFQTIDYDGEPEWQAKLTRGPVRVLNVIAWTGRYDVWISASGFESPGAVEIAVVLAIDTQATFIPAGATERVRIGAGEFVVFTDLDVMQTLEHDPCEPVSGALVCVAIRPR
jgi:environmental stress-induced protein Ves